MSVRRWPVWIRLLIFVVAGVTLLALVLRIPVLAGHRDLGVVHGAPADVPLGIEPALAVSRTAAETDRIWAGLDMLWDQLRSVGGPPAIDYGREILVLATVFASSS